MNNKLFVVVKVDDHKYLNATLDSLLRQSYKPIEISVILRSNDTSSRSIINSYPNKSSLTYQIEQSLEQEIVCRKNSTINKSGFWSIVQAGTILSPRWAEDSISILKKSPEAIGIISKAVVLTDAGSLAYEPKPQEVTPEFLFINSYLNTAKIINSPYIIRFDENSKLDINGGISYYMPVTDSFTSGVRSYKTANSRYDSYAISQMIDNLNFDSIYKTYQQLSIESEIFATAYIDAFSDFFKYNIRKLHMINSFKLLTLLLLKPGFRKVFIYKIIGISV